MLKLATSPHIDVVGYVPIQNIGHLIESTGLWSMPSKQQAQ